MVLVCVAVSVAAIWLWRAKDQRYGAAYPYQCDPAHRLRVTAWGKLLPAAEGVIARARATGGQEFSEPEWFRITHASESPREIAFCASMCVAVAALALALVRIRLSPHLPVVGIPWLGLLLVLMLVRTVWGFLWPTVVRVAPGRLEVVRSPLLGLGRPTATAFDLRTARVLVDPRYGRVLVQRPGEEGVWLSGVMGRSVSGGQEMGLAAWRRRCRGLKGKRGRTHDCVRRGDRGEEESGAVGGESV